jgi:hypothetical protein
MSKDLSEMKNQELIQYCKEEGIEVKAKNPSKPNKTELITAIKEFEKEQMDNIDDFLAQDDIEPEVEDIDTGSVSKPEKMTRAQKRAKQRRELFPLKRVIITSNSTNQTQTPLQFITWGNGLIGHQTDRVYLGKKWHVREGALRNLRNAIIREPVMDDEGNTVKFETRPAYNIQELPPLTKEEIEVIAKRQTIRDSSIESLI